MRGIWFVTADRIARAGGIPRDAPERIDAGLVHVLTEVAREGHTVTGEREATGAAADVLGLPDEALGGSVDRVVSAGLAVRVRGEALSPRPLAEAKESIAVRVAALLRTRGAAVAGLEDALAGIEGGARPRARPPAAEGGAPGGEVEGFDARENGPPFCSRE